MASHVQHRDPLLRAIRGIVGCPFANGDMRVTSQHGDLQVKLKVAARVGLSARELEALACGVPIQEVAHDRVTIPWCREVPANLASIIAEDHGRGECPGDGPLITSVDCTKKGREKLRYIRFPA